MADAARNTDPVLDVIRVSNEGLRRIVLDNGMVCLLKEDRSAPVVALQIWVGTGAVHEEQYLGAGLSHYMEHMIFKGTPTRGPADISRQIDDAGGEINAYTAQDRTVFYADLPSKTWRVGIDVLSDAVMNAALPEEEWEREKDVILREFAMGRDNPDRELSKLLWSTAYREHPYRVPVIGYEDVFRAMTRDDLSTFFRRHYVPDNMITVMVGDIDADEVEAYVRHAFAGFTRRPRAPVTLPAEPPQMTPRFARHTGPYQVSRLQWAYHTVPLNHPDAAALDVLASIVGQGRSSRLSRKIKEELRLVHDIDAWSYTPKDPGLFGISAVFDPTNETAVIEAIQKEIEAWTRAPFAGEEIEKAKRMTLVNELDGLQTMSGQASSYAAGEYYAGNPRFAEYYLANLEHVTPDLLRDVARRYLRTENRTIAMLSPAMPGETRSEQRVDEPGIRLSLATLTNGIRLIVREDHRLPFVYICAAFGGGLLSEKEDNNGVTQLMSELLTRGTARRSADDIALSLIHI
jgi:zinc protease